MIVAYLKKNKKYQSQNNNNNFKIKIKRENLSKMKRGLLMRKIQTN